MQSCCRYMIYGPLDLLAMVLSSGTVVLFPGAATACLDYALDATDKQRSKGCLISCIFKLLRFPLTLLVQ